MTHRPERAHTVTTLPADSGTGGAPSVGVAAPIGAVSRKDRERAGKTSLQQEGTGSLVLHTALPGNVRVQRRNADGTWETIDSRRASRWGRTRIDLPPEADAPPQTFRVVFSPKNSNIAAWVSGNIGS